MKILANFGNFRGFFSKIFETFDKNFQILRKIFLKFKENFKRRWLILKSTPVDKINEIFKNFKFENRRRPQAPTDVPTLILPKSRLFKSRLFGRGGEIADNPAKFPKEILPKFAREKPRLGVPLATGRSPEGCPVGKP